MTARNETAWTATADGLRLAIHLTPKSARDAVEGVAMQNGAPVLKLRVRAVPEDGKANAAAIETLARWLDMPHSRVTLEAGGKSRTKRFRIVGDTAAIETAIKRRLETPG